MSDDDLINEAQLCQHLNLPRTTAQDLIRRGILPRPIKLGSRIARWQVSEVKAAVRALANARRAA
jgi:predicted DNA-binding transcriptional regulator AlpA